MAYTDLGKDSFGVLVPYIKQRLELHHQLYSGQCKAELWEEACAWALRKANFGSDWKPDFNHAVGVDQYTDSGIGISNKGGKLIFGDNTVMKISGSRLTKHKTINEKLEFLKSKPEDYVFCLATNNADLKKGNMRYFFVVVDAKKLDYHNQLWEETYPRTGSDVPNGYRCETPLYKAKISKSMSDQLWTDISSDLFEEIHEISIDTQELL